MNQPTGVFVRLPLSEERAITFHKESSHAWDEFNGSSNALACEAGLLAIGTPVTGGDLYPVGYIAEDAIGGLATGIYQSASIFRNADKEHHDTVALVRFESAQAAIAALEAEVGRLREYYEANEDIKRTGLFGATAEMFDRESLAREALKGPEA